MPELTPEQRSRKNIDGMLEAAGWVVQDLKQMDLGAALGVAVRELPLSTGFSGKLVPQDPKDEPADKLLERIKAGRMAVGGHGGRRGRRRVK